MSKAAILQMPSVTSAQFMVSIFKSKLLEEFLCWNCILLYCLGTIKAFRTNNKKRKVYISLQSMQEVRKEMRHQKVCSTKYLPHWFCLTLWSVRAIRVDKIVRRDTIMCNGKREISQLRQNFLVWKHLPKFREPHVEWDASVPLYCGQIFVCYCLKGAIKKVSHVYLPSMLNKNNIF